jgi:transposase
MTGSRPQVVADADYEQTLARAAAVDVAKATGMVCLRGPNPDRPETRLTRVWEVPATTRAISEVAEQLSAEGVEMVTLEATSDYWRPWFYLLEAAGVPVQLVNARDVKNVPGRPKTDKLDAVWLAKLTERGMLRPSFMPPAEIRVLRDYTRMRSDLVHEQSRYWQRIEKLLEDALIKISSVASTMTGVSVRAMLEALIAGERDPHVLAELARGKLRIKRAALIEALTGRFDAHHAELARMLLEHVDKLARDIDQLTARIEALIADIPAAQGVDADGTTGPDAGRNDKAIILPVIDQLDEITGVGRDIAQVIVAEVGLTMSQFPSAAHLASWAKISPRTVQSGNKKISGRTGRGNPYLKSALANAAVASARTDTFLGERYRRLVKRIGKGRALVAVQRSILVIVYELLSDRTSRYQDLGAGYYATRTDTEKKARNHIRQLKALGFQVTVAPAA